MYGILKQMNRLEYSVHASKNYNRLCYLTVNNSSLSVTRK